MIKVSFRAVRAAITAAELSDSSCKVYRPTSGMLEEEHLPLKKGQTSRYNLDKILVRGCRKG